MSLPGYVMAHTAVGVETIRPEDTVDMVFAKVAVVGQPDPAEFRALIDAHAPVWTGRLDLFDGAEHNWIEIGGWIGDQGLAIRFMAMLVALDLLYLLSPDTMIEPAGAVSESDRQDLAHSGVLAVRTTPPEVMSVRPPGSPRP